LNTDARWLRKLIDEALTVAEAPDVLWIFVEGFGDTRRLCRIFKLTTATGLIADQVEGLLDDGNACYTSGEIADARTAGICAAAFWRDATGARHGRGQVWLGRPQDMEYMRAKAGILRAMYEHGKRALTLEDTNTPKCPRCESSFYVAPPQLVAGELEIKVSCSCRETLLRHDGETLAQAVKRLILMRD
jgi:hypothetical protein